MPESNYLAEVVWICDGVRINFIRGYKRKKKLLIYWLTTCGFVLFFLSTFLVYDEKQGPYSYYEHKNIS